ncbi:MAG: hypothetical protein V1729_02625 [Candidatus Woesearchaeota archaeon]
MVVKRYYASPFCYLCLKIKMDLEWAEQLELLVQISGLQDIDELVKTLLAWRLLTEQDAIHKQKQKNLESHKTDDDYWRYNEKKQ